MTPTVLHYVGYDREGGGILAVLRTLAATGRTRGLLGVGPGFPRGGRMSGLRPWRGPAIEAETISLGTSLRSLGVAWRVRRWLRRGGNRVFHGHSRAGLLVVLWLQLLGARRAVASVHCLGRQRWFYRFAARVLGDRLFWLGPAMKRHYGLGDASWAQCVPDALPETAFEPATLAGERGAELRVGCVGAVVRVKQWELVLQALAALPCGVRAQVVHAGGDDGTVDSAAYARELQALAGRLALADRVEWCGPLHEMKIFYRRIDVLVVPSRWEAASVAALEALAAGVPVIAAEDSGTRDLIEASGAGGLFRSDDASDLARALAAAAGGNEAGAGVVDRTRLVRFRAGSVAAEWEAVYRAVVDRKG